MNCELGKDTRFPPRMEAREVRRYFNPMQIESIQIGGPRTVGTEGADDPRDRPWTSAIWKTPVEGAVWADRGGLTGDHVVDRRHHGGPERAILMYAGSHYPRWRAEWGRRDIFPGAFGENLTVEGLDEDRVCLGDVFEVGAIRLEVSAPRAPCLTLARRHQRPGLVEEVIANGRHGWYVRVRRAGWLEAGMEVTLRDRPFPQWTVARAGRVKWGRGLPEERRLLGLCPALIEEWRRALALSGDHRE